MQVSASEPILNRAYTLVKGFYNKYIGIEILMMVVGPERRDGEGKGDKRRGRFNPAVDTPVNRALIICLIRWEGALHGLHASRRTPPIDTRLLARTVCRA